jgi:hypothetical protein
MPSTGSDWMPNTACYRVRTVSRSRWGLRCSTLPMIIKHNITGEPLLEEARFKELSERILGS